MKNDMDETEMALWETTALVIMAVARNTPSMHPDTLKARNCVAEGIAAADALIAARRERLRGRDDN